MDPIMIRESLGLAEDASDDAVLATVTAMREQIESEGLDLPEGMAVIDKNQLEDLKVAASAGVQAREQQLAEERSRFIDQAVQAGKFRPAERDHYVALMEAAPDKTKALIEVMASGSVPVAELGHTQDVHDNTDAEHASVMASFGVALPQGGSHA